MFILQKNLINMILNSIKNLKNRTGFLFTDEEMYHRENADRNNVIEAFAPIASQLVERIIKAGNDYQHYAEKHPVARRENNFVSTMLHGLIIEELQQIPDMQAEKIGKTSNTILRFGTYKIWVKKLDDDGKPNINKTKSSVKRINQCVDGSDTLPMLILGYQLDDIQRITIGGDVIGRIYEYFLSKFAKAVASDDGVFFTPKSLVKMLVNVLEPEQGVMLDPACGSGGMFVQTGDFVNAGGMNANTQMTFYGQEKVKYNAQLCLMNMAIHGLSGEIAV